MLNIGIKLGQGTMVIGRLKSLFGKPAAARALAFDAPLAPDHAIYVFGDIHGCLDELEAQIARVEAQAGDDPDARFVFIGDYVDRGPKSAQVLQLLYDRAQQDPDRNVFIFGNHERMMLQFLDDPAGKGRRWLQYGGIETLASFGITEVSARTDLEDLVDISLALEQALGAELQAWLRAMPVIWSSGNVHCTHAALDPEEPIDRQKKQVMLWGHPAFFEVARTDGQWVVHGHTIVDEPSSHSGRIVTDTGAYETGRLTVAAISKGNVTFS